MPSRDAHLQFQKWAQDYGPLYSFILATKTLIVLSSDVAVKDLLDKKSSIYSDHQYMYIGQTFCSGDLRLLMMVSPVAKLGSLSGRRKIRSVMAPSGGSSESWSMVCSIFKLRKLMFPRKPHILPRNLLMPAVNQFPPHILIPHPLINTPYFQRSKTCRCVTSISSVGS